MDESGVERPLITEQLAQKAMWINDFIYEIEPKKKVTHVAKDVMLRVVNKVDTSRGAINLLEGDMGSGKST